MRVSRHHLDALLKTVAAVLSEIEEQYSIANFDIRVRDINKAARRIPSLLNKNGHAIVAGFRAGQTEYFQEIFQENNLTPVGDYALNDWGALLLSNKECDTQVQPLIP